MLAEKMILNLLKHDDEKYCMYVLACFSNGEVKHTGTVYCETYEELWDYVHCGIEVYNENNIDFMINDSIGK